MNCAYVFYGFNTEADLGEGHGVPGPPPPLFWVRKKKEAQKKEKPAGQATKKTS